MKCFHRLNFTACTGSLFLMQIYVSFYKQHRGLNLRKCTDIEASRVRCNHLTCAVANATKSVNQLVGKDKTIVERHMEDLGNVARMYS